MDPMDLYNQHTAFHEIEVHLAAEETEQAYEKVLRLIAWMEDGSPFATPNNRDEPEWGKYKRAALFYTGVCETLEHIKDNPPEPIIAAHRDAHREEQARLEEDYLNDLGGRLMDPNATLKQMSEYLQAGEVAKALDSGKDLYDWLKKGGFDPKWENYQEAADFYYQHEQDGVLGRVGEPFDPHKAIVKIQQLLEVLQHRKAYGMTLALITHLEDGGTQPAWHLYVKATTFYLGVDQANRAAARLKATHQGKPVNVEDHREKKVYGSGAARSGDSEHVRFDLIPVEAQYREAIRWALGSKKFGANNWKQGMPTHVVIQHIEHHLALWKLGHHTDDNLAAMRWGTAVLMWQEKYDPELIKKDYPDWQPCDEVACLGDAPNPFSMETGELDTYIEDPEGLREQLDKDVKEAVGLVAAPTYPQRLTYTGPELANVIMRVRQSNLPGSSAGTLLTKELERAGLDHVFASEQDIVVAVDEKSVRYTVMEKPKPGRQIYCGPHLAAALKCLNAGCPETTASWMNRDLGELDEPLASHEGLKITDRGEIEYQPLGNKPEPVIEHKITSKAAEEKISEALKACMTIYQMNRFLNSKEGQALVSQAGLTDRSNAEIIGMFPKE